ncbi:MAG: SEC-C metal-binding domain-containing protein [Anaerolineae bacterium]
MLASIQSQIVRSIFLVPRSAVEVGRRRADADYTAQPRQRQLTFKASGGSQAGDSSPEPVRTSDKPGRNDPCWCGSGKKYKDCHWRSDRRAAMKASDRARASH